MAHLPVDSVLELSEGGKNSVGPRRASVSELPKSSESRSWASPIPGTFRFLQGRLSLSERGLLDYALVMAFVVVGIGALLIGLDIGMIRETWVMGSR